MKSRFDTRFFLAIPPSGQSFVPDNREMEKGRKNCRERG
jgi:hypothetical protein